jgi:hypothetical protein
LIAAIGIKRLGLAAAALAGAAFAALVLLSLLIPADTVRDAIKAEIRAVTGLDPVLRGDVAVSLFPSGTVVFDQVALGDNHRCEPAMTVDQLVVRFRFFRLLIGSALPRRRAGKRPSRSRLRPTDARTGRAMSRCWRGPCNPVPIAWCRFPRSGSATAR